MGGKIVFNSQMKLSLLLLLLLLFQLLFQLNLPINCIASSKYCLRFWHPLSEAGSLLYLIPWFSKYFGICDVIFSM